jgi:CheY-like chemotaxis protein
VFGMPREAIACSAAMQVATLLHMPALIPEWLARAAGHRAAGRGLQEPTWPRPVSPRDYSPRGAAPITSLAMDSPRRLAHDLNNIAFVISGYAQRLEESLEKSDPRQEDVQAILAEVPRLSTVVDRVRRLGGEPDESFPVAPRTHRILLVEDDPAVRELLRHALESRGYHVDAGCTGEEGLALCDVLDPPDLLITDLILPGATGPLIAERLRRRAPGVKVLLMSGSSEHPRLEAAHAAGEPCLVKPFEINQFSETVARLLDRTRAA